MTDDARRISEALTRSVLRILHKLARLLLRHGMPLPAFIDLAKRAYLDVAMNDMAIPGRKPSVSRAALLTGLTRKEVQHLLSEPLLPNADAMAAHNRAARVVAGWVRDKRFHDEPGRPRPLEFDGAEGSFTALVRGYSGDMPPRAVLDELLRVGTVERDGDGRIRLLSRVYIPRASEIGKLNILGSDVAFLIDTIDHNLQQGGPAPRFQRKVMYDNLPAEALEEFRALSAQQAQALLERFDAWLAQHDRDMNPAVRGTGRVRAGVGIFAFEEDVAGTPPGGPR